MLCSVSLTNVFFFSLNNYVSLKYIQLSLNFGVATFLGKGLLILLAICFFFVFFFFFFFFFFLGGCLIVFVCLSL